MNKNLFDTMCDMESICVDISKLQYLASEVFDLASPCNANDTEFEQMAMALYNQPHIATVSSMILDYLDTLETQCKKATDTIGDIWKLNNKSEVNNNGIEQSTTGTGQAS